MINRARHFGRKILTKLPVGVQQSYYHYRTSKLSLPAYLRHSKEADILSLLPTAPKTIVDIGANRGKWTQGFLDLLGNDASFHLFEPTPTLYQHLKMHFSAYPNVHLYDIAVSDAIGTATFNIAESDDLSSLEQFNSNEFTGNPRTKRIEVTTDTLDHIYTHLLNGIEIDLLKIDTQGHEEKIITAAEEALQHTKALLVEWNIVQLYETASTFASVHTCLVNKGFRLSSILNQNRRGYELSWADALYVNRHYMNEAS